MVIRAHSIYWEFGCRTCLTLVQVPNGKYTPKCPECGKPMELLVVDERSPAPGFGKDARA